MASANALFSLCLLPAAGVFRFFCVFVFHWYSPSLFVCVYGFTISGNVSREGLPCFHPRALKLIPANSSFPLSFDSVEWIPLELFRLVDCLESLAGALYAFVFARPLCLYLIPCFKLCVCVCVFFSQKRKWTDLEKVKRWSDRSTCKRRY